MVFGAIQWPWPARQLLLVGAVTTAFAVCLLLLADSAVAVGAALSGYVMDAYGVAHGWSVAIAAGALLVLIAGAAYRQLRSPPAADVAPCAV